MLSLCVGCAVTRVPLHTLFITWFGASFFSIVVHYTASVIIKTLFKDMGRVLFIIHMRFTCLIFIMYKKRSRICIHKRLSLMFIHLYCYFSPLFI